MSKSTGIWDTVLKVIIAVASAVLGVFGANTMTF
ncbi:smalltalk protein [Bacteroides clarus]